MKFVNLTPHAIVLNDDRYFPPSGEVARVSVGFQKISGIFYQQNFGLVTGLPNWKPDTTLIVSAMVLAATTCRSDVVAPATGHPDVVRNEEGHIVSVPGFVVKS